MTRFIDFATAEEARRLAAALDQRLGYPRQHTEEEIVRTGPAARRVPIEEIRTETHTRPLRYTSRDGERYAVHVDPVIESLRGERETVDGVEVVITDEGARELDDEERGSLAPLRDPDDAEKEPDDREPPGRVR